MNYGLQYVQLVPRPMVLPYNPYSQYSSMPQPQPYLSHSQTQQTSASNHHPQTQSSPQFLNSVPPTQQTAASMTIASPVNHHYVPYSPPLQSQQQPVASYSSPMVSYFSPPPAARFHYAAHPQEMTLNTNEYMPGQLENGFRAIKRVWRSMESAVVPRKSGEPISNQYLLLGDPWRKSSLSMDSQNQTLIINI